MGIKTATTTIKSTTSIVLFSCAAIIAAFFVVSHRAGAACTPPTTSLGKVDGSFSIPAAGTYTVWARIKVPDSANNSLVLDIDGTNCGNIIGDAVSTVNSWVWVNYKSGNTANIFTTTLAAGNHTYTVHWPENGVQLERIIFASDPACVPSGSGENCVPVTTTPAPTPTPTQNTQNFKVVGYFGEDADITKIRFAEYTHLNFAFVLPGYNGQIEGPSNPAFLRDAVTRSRAAGNKILVSVGGWQYGGDTSRFDAVTANDAILNTFVTSVDTFITNYALDGVDIDWEFPNDASAARYTKLMAALSARLKPKGKLVTAAVDGSSYVGNSIQPESFASVDFLNIMSYNDFARSQRGLGHSTYDFAVDSVNFYTSRGLPASKLVLGVPFYGSGSAGSSTETYVAFKDLVTRATDAAYRDELNGVFYNGIPTIEAKTRLALQRGGGIMIWEINQDSTGPTSLVTAIKRTVAAAQTTGTTAPAPTVSLTAPTNGASVSGASVALTANATGATPISKVEFLIDNIVVATDTTSPYEYVWNSTATTNGQHTISARAYDANLSSTSQVATVTVTNQAPTVTSFEAETMTLPTNAGRAQTDTAASGGQMLFNWGLTGATATATKTVTTSSANRITIRARGDQCNGAPQMVVTLDGTQILSVNVAATTYTDYTASANVSAGSHTLTIAFTNDEFSTCDRNLIVDKVDFSTVVTTTPPAPTTPPTTALRCDFTGDGVVNSRDLAVFLGGYNKRQLTYDLNKDGRVNSQDLAIMLGRCK